MKNITSSVYSFEKLRQEGYLYVDKTEYIWNLINPAGVLRKKQKIGAKAPRISKIWIDKRFWMVYNDFPYCGNMPR